MAIKPGHGLADWEVATLRKIVGIHGRLGPNLDRREYEDLLQECLAHWISVRDRLPQGPDIPPRVAYMAQVIRNKLTDIVRERTSSKRAGSAGAFSFEQPLDDQDDGATLSEMISESDLVSSSGPLADERDLLDLRIDLLRALQRMKPADRELCRLLGEEGMSVTEVAQYLQMPRGTVYEQIKRIRERLSRLGLEGYLKK